MVADSKTERFMELFYNDTTPNTLWHYTNCDGLLGIVNNRAFTLRFTRSDCLNDTSEGEEIKQCYDWVCDRLVKDSVISQEFYDAIKNIEPTKEKLLVYPSPSEENKTLKRKMSVTSISFDKCETDLCCFSGSRDSLDMWRYYTNNDGYSLGFQTLCFQNLVNKRFDEYTEGAQYNFVQFEPVLYDIIEKNKKLKNIVTEIYNEFKNKKYNLEMCVVLLKSKINEIQYQFKAECFKSEHEYRLIYYRPISKPKTMKLELPEIKYRNRNGLIAPYVDLTFRADELKLEQLYISPFLKGTAADEKAREYICTKGFDKCNVIQSNLPVRF